MDIRPITAKRTWLRQPVADIVRECWDAICEDGQEKDWEPRIDADSRWYVTFEGGQAVGAFLMRRIGSVTWEAHANVRPSHWGDGKGTEHCKAALKVMTEDTGAKKVVAAIPTCCPQVIKMAEEIGFEREGVSAQSWLKGGVLHDRIYYGITRT